MKELSIEEKAKAYDGNYKAYTELINRLEDVKDAIKKQNYGIAMDILCKPYPGYQITISTELKESEDEKIRKYIIDYFKGNKEELSEGFKWNGITVEEVIAWLEKQGEQKQETNYPKFDFDDILALQCCMETAEKVQKDKELYEKLKSLHSRLHDVYWIEKQGEQKSYVSETMNEKEDFDNGFTRMMEKEQKSAWSEEDEKYLKIAIDNFQTLGNSFLTAWLKSLKDRVQPQQEWSEEDEKHLKGCMQYFTTITKNSIFYKDYLWLKSLKDRVQPKQEWSEEIRQEYERKYNEGKAIGIELGKDEANKQMLKWSEEDEDNIFNIAGALDVLIQREIEKEYNGDRNASPKYYSDLQDWLKSLKGRVQPKPAWSEEDEKMQKEAIRMVERPGSIFQGTNLTKKVADWLKSLKDRILPLPKQEWSEEDEKEVAILEAYIRSKDWSERHVDRALGIVDELVNKVKSLRPQNTWKPSEEQLDALHDAAVYVDKSMFPYPKGILMKLYEQLKKLK